MIALTNFVCLRTDKAPTTFISFQSILPVKNEKENKQEQRKKTIRKSLKLAN